jgi:hypothetical protein
MRVATAPSFRVEELPAVTEPSFVKAGLSAARPSRVVPRRMDSSVVTSATGMTKPSW